jgi:hypothetical protein
MAISIFTTTRISNPRFATLQMFYERRSKGTLFFSVVLNKCVYIKTIHLTGA